MYMIKQKFYADTQKVYLGIWGMLQLPKIQLENIESDFTKDKERIQDIIQLHLDQIKECIEAPLTSLMRIDLFLSEWKNIKKKEIASVI